MSPVAPLPDAPLVGYLEGFYGRLLGWSEREALLDALERNAMGAWWHAPKEDPAHRTRWREPHGAAWRAGFARFCRSAAARHVSVIAGLAPGIDFDWRDVDGGPDLDALVAKTRGYLDAGAAVPALLLDDLDDDFAARAGAGASEGATHARLANALGERLGRALVVVPRVYANELHAGAPDYLPDFSSTLDPAHAISLCGTDVVSRTVAPADCRRHLTGRDRRIVVWDNLYANDYCPRRLFLGPWTGREGLADALVNPTGMSATDALLLDVVGDERAHPGRADAERAAALARIRARHGVPEAFAAVAHHCDRPATNPEPGNGSANAAVGPDAMAVARHAAGVGPAPDAAALARELEALDALQWRWKSALAREWYPHLAGLRHDLAIRAGSLAPLRVAKTQPAPLAAALLEGAGPPG